MGVELVGNKSTSDLGIDIPTATSDLDNDSGFITNTVNNLVNYYLKTETYTKAEVAALISAITTLDIRAVSTLPTEDISTTTIYLIPKTTASTNNAKDEYINLDGTSAGWELIGDTVIDLSNYVTTEALTTALAGYVTSTALTTTLADYVTNTALTTALSAKQDTLTFDDAPTASSNNPVKSGGVYSAINSIEALGKRVSSTVSGLTVAFTDASIADTASTVAVIDGPYIENAAANFEYVTVSGTTATFTLADDSADTETAFIWVRTVDVS